MFNECVLVLNCLVKVTNSQKDVTLNDFFFCRRPLETVCKRNFLTGGQEVGEIIPISVWIIPFPVFKPVLDSLVKVRNIL